MQTTHTRWRRASALFWLALAIACGNSGDEARERDRDDDGEPPDRTTEPEAPSPHIALAMNDPATRAPFDATPSPDAREIYYTALGGEPSDPVPGVFGIAATGGEIRTLALGEPLTAPVNITVSLDGTQLFVADPAASVVFTLANTGGTPTSLAGTEGYAPRGLVVAKLRDGREYVYFTGRSPESQEAGLYRVATTGGAVETVASGAPFSDPAGVIVDSNATAYVVENGSEGPSASVIRVANGAASVFVDGIGVGFPAGITLTRDAQTLLVSGLDPATQRDVVYFVDTGTKQISRLTDTVGAFREAAGLHRAHDADVFAWADSQANGGSVFSLELERN